MKKIIIDLGIIFTLIICMCSVSYGAALKATINVTADKTEVEPGSTVTISMKLINVSDAEGGIVGAVAGIIEYDKNFFEDFKYSGISINLESGKFSKMDRLVDGSDIGTVTLKVKDNATGTGTIKFTKLAANDGRDDYEAGEASTPDTTITITAKKSGKTPIDENTTKDENKTTEQSTTKDENKTTEQSTTKDQNKTTEQSTTKDQNKTTEQSTTKDENKTTEQSTTKDENKTTEQSTTKDENKTTEQSTTKDEDKTTEQSTTKDENKITEQSTTKDGNKTTDKGEASEEKTTTDENKTSVTRTNNKTTENKGNVSSNTSIYDNTTKNGSTLPKTGEKTFIIPIILIVIIVTIIVYKKSIEYKDI